MNLTNPTCFSSYVYTLLTHFNQVERAFNFADKVTILSENGAKTILVPMDNLAELATLPTSILGKTDVPFYGNGQMLLQKAVLGE